MAESTPPVASPAAPPVERPRISLDANAPAAPKGRRASIAAIAAKAETKFAKSRDSIDHARHERIASARITHKFTPTAQNRKDDAPVSTEPPKTEPPKTEPPKADTPVQEQKSDKTDALVADVPARVQKSDKTDAPAADVPARESTPAALPAEVVRSLKAFGITDAQIADGLKTSGAAFEATAQMLHAARKKEITEFANIGRVKAGTLPPPPSAPPAAAPGVIDLKPLDLAELQKSTNSADGLAKIVGTINSVVARIQQAEAARHAAATQDVTARVERFFASSELAAYKEDYANPQSRAAVMDMATHILNGMTQAGKRSTLEEALTMAHDATMAPKMKEAARQQIQQDIQQRAAGISQKPSGATGGTTEAKPKSRQDLYAWVRASLRKI